jgi:hypothetical protein
MNSYAPSLFAWHRFLQGWLDVNQIACTTKSFFESNSLILKLSGVNNNDKEVKIAMAKLNENEILVIESRTNSGFDSISDDHEGVLVYIVDVRKKSNEGAISLLTPSFAQEKDRYIIGSLKPGRSIDIGELEVVVLEKFAEGFVVTVRKR